MGDEEVLMGVRVPCAYNIIASNKAATALCTVTNALWWSVLWLRMIDGSNKASKLCSSAGGRVYIVLACKVGHRCSTMGSVGCSWSSTYTTHSIDISHVQSGPMFGWCHKKAPRHEV